MTTDLATSPTRPDRPPARRRRRLLWRLLVGALALGLAGVLGLAGLAAWFWSQADTSNVGQLRFANQLKIPPLLQPRLDSAGRKVFDLRLQQGTSELLAGKPTRTWGANGAYLGPTIRATRGDQVRMNVANDLPEATTIHWHGMHLPAAADGGPHQPIQPGRTWSPSWRINQPAATLWYHPHPHGATENHVYRGPGRAFPIGRPGRRRPAAARPVRRRRHPRHRPGQAGRRRGESRLRPVVVQPRRPPRRPAAGQRHPRPPPEHHQPAGAAAAAECLHRPHLPCRFRRRPPLRPDGTDGGLLEHPHQTARVPLSPGERAEIVAEFRPGERVVLRSFPSDLGLDPFQGRFAGADDTFGLLHVRAGPKLTPSPPVPDRLVRHRHLDQAGGVRTRRLELNGSSRINDRRMDLGRIDQTVTVDTTEVWEVTNRSGNPHNFHVHGVQFNVASHLGGPPPPHLAGWKDTVFIPPAGTVRLLVQFPGYSDPILPYMFHCHLLEHEDNGMMGQVLVVQPGQPPTSVSQQHHHYSRQNPTSRDLQPESDRVTGP